VVLLDAGGSSRDSYKQYYSDEAGDTSVRPILTVVLGSGTTTATTTTTTTTTSSSTGVKLRVLQWNLHHGVGTDGKYDLDRIATWMAKMTPDVVMLNEVEKYTGWGNEDQPSRSRSLLQSKTAKTWYTHFAQEYGDWSSNGKGHLILSRYPFESTDYTTTTASSGLKGAGAASQATIIVNGRRINLFIGHLDPDSSTMRLTQAREVINWASTYPESRIITGDMNAWPDQSSIAEINKTYRDSWAVASSKGTAYQFSGLSPDGATKKGRIDYIFYSRNTSNLAVVSSKVYDTRDSNGYMPSDHRPVVTTFEVR
jgi:endonuclease/exonuclease/phosphatase family metal-dependent hydrolase